MNTRMLKSTMNGCMEEAIEILQNGGVVAFPTDTVYGIGTSAFNDEAVSKLYEVKGRSTGQAVPILISDLHQFEKVASDIPSLARRLAEKFWPGPITLVVGKDTGLAAAVSPYDTVGVRMPNHRLVLALLHAVGPMAVTSANTTGSPSLSDASEVFEVMKGKIELVIDGGTAPGQVPSTVVDCTGNVPVVLREGPITQSEIDLLFSS